MTESWWIKNGRVLDPSFGPSGTDATLDLLIEDGKIAALEKPGQIPASRAQKSFDAKGQWVVPGLVDIHVHLREPGLEYKETIQTGTRAALASGFTSLACMANTQPVNDNPYVTAFIRERARAEGACRVFPIGAVSKGLKGEELAEIGGMVQEGAKALSDDGMPVMNSYLMRKAMDYARAFGVPIISHAEDANLVGQGVMNEGALSNELGLRGNPGAAEEIMVAREIALCRLTGCPVHIAHLSTKQALEHVRRAKADGLPVTAEVSPHHLTLTEEALRTYDTCCKMAPPLRTAADVEALHRGLNDGTIDVIATDHAPHGLTDKAVEFDQAANGILGLQTAVPLTLALIDSGALTPLAWVSALSTAPSKLLKLEYGTLQIGRPADVTVIDPRAPWKLTPEQILSKSKNTPFIDRPLKGRATAVWLGGNLKWKT